MKPVVYANSNIVNSYEDNSFLGRIRDKLKISFKREFFIKELNLSIASVKLPPNLDRGAYRNNILTAKRIFKSKEVNLAPKGYRYLDYNFFNDFQKSLMAFGIVASSKLILRNKQKSIRDGCIVIYNASDDIIFDTICFLAKEAKYIILLSDNINKTNKIAQYVIANYGVAPIVTSDIEYSLKNADITISSREIELNSKTFVWYLDNKYLPSEGKNIAVNDVSYKVPWDFSDKEMPFELLGSILCQMSEKDIEKSLKYNGILLDRIKFNDKTLIV